MTNVELARQRLREGVAQGLAAWKAAGRIGDPVDTITQHVLQGEYLITGGAVRLVQEVDYKDETDDSRTYEVYTEPDQ